MFSSDVIGKDNELEAVYQYTNLPGSDNITYTDSTDFTILKCIVSDGGASHQERLINAICWLDLLKIKTYQDRSEASSHKQA